MSSGKILVYDSAGNYLLKLTGDVRVTLCGALNRHMDRIFGSSAVNQVVIDMLEAECLDSTTLGILAKLGFHCRREYGVDAKIFCHNPSILRMLEVMGFNEIFEIFDQDINKSFATIALEPLTSEDAEIRRQVLEAHKTLIELCPDNNAQFYDLINALESSS